MSEPRILLLGCASAGADPASALALVETIAVPGGERLVLTTGKFDTRKRARTLNVEAGYPPSIVAFQNRFLDADGINARLHYEDGFDVLSISESMDRLSGFDFLIMMRTAFEQPADWSQVLDWNAIQHFRLFGSRIDAQAAGPDARNLLIDVRASDQLFLHALRDLFQTGSTFAIEPYSLEQTLCTAADAAGAIARLSSAR